MTLSTVEVVVLVAFAALLGLIVVLLVRGAAAADRQRVRRRLQCPVLDEPADCVLVRDSRTARWLGVASCSLLPPARTCSEECARLLELGAELKPHDEPPAPAGAPRPRP